MTLALIIAVVTASVTVIGTVGVILGRALLIIIAVLMAVGDRLPPVGIALMVRVIHRLVVAVRVVGVVAGILVLAMGLSPDGGGCESGQDDDRRQDFHGISSLDV